MLVQELKALREAGIRTFAKAEATEAEQRHREADAVATSQLPAQSGNPGFSTPLPLHRPEVDSSYQVTSICCATSNSP